MKTLLPAFVAILIAAFFFYRLRKLASSGIVAEIGALYVLFLLAYTISPAFTFAVVDLDRASGWVWSSLTALFPSDDSLALHLWRHVLFMFGVCLAYLCVRAKPDDKVSPPRVVAWDGGRVILPLAVFVVLSNVILVALSAPVLEYSDHYTRYDNLPSVVRALVSVLARLENGLYIIALSLCMMNFRTYRVMAVLLVAGAFLYKIWYSLGSRIESLFILLLAVCLFQVYVRRISVGKMFLGLLVIGGLYSLLEVFRSVNFSIEAAEDALLGGSLQPASEFGAVFYTSFHLYAERAAGTLPPVPWQMFFNDIITLFTPNSFVKYNPQHWYAETYFPTFDVPPQTNGPIADSALWGGEVDLFIRALINGALFACIANLFFSRKHDWRMAAIYGFCYSTCVMTLKYSIFYHVNPIVKTLIPCIVLVWGGRTLLSQRQAASPKAPA